MRAVAEQVTVGLGQRQSWGFDELQGQAQVGT